MLPIKNEYFYFLSVCEHLNFSHAAVALGLQQAALSKAIKKIEQEHGKKLFLRQSRSLKLTEFGEIMLRQLIKQKSLWEEDFFELMEEYDDISGRMSVCLHQTIAINSLGKVMHNLNELHENLFVDIVFDRSFDVVKKVASGEHDFGVAIVGPGYSDLVVKKLQKEYIGLWSNTGKSTKVLYYNPEMLSILSHIKKFKDHKKVPIQSYELMAKMATLSKGVFLLPSPIAENVPSLKLINKAGEGLDLSIFYRFDKPKTKAFTAILDIITSHFQ